MLDMAIAGAVSPILTGIMRKMGPGWEGRLLGVLLGGAQKRW